MNNNVFILGAGASKSSGAPLMLEFFDKAQKVYSLYQGNDNIKNYKNDFENVFQSLIDLKGIYSKAFLDLDNLETLFGAIEMGLILEKFGSRDKGKIRVLKNSLINVIVKTLEFTMPFPVISLIINPPETYNIFIKNLNRLIKQRDNYKFSFITFNYDLAIDYSLAFNEVKYNYFINDSPSDEIPLLKLHGSINWHKEEIGTKIEFIDVSKARSKVARDTNKIFLTLGSDIITSQKIPIIIPPTWNKSEHHQQIENVWRKAAKELSIADNIFIIGYSLPETDMFFRYLYGLGTESERRLNAVYVFNPDKENEANYRKMIGQGILTRRFYYQPITFERSIGFIKQELEKQIKI